MCGLTGFLQPQRLDEGAERTVRAMADAISHRGPDDSGTWIDAEAGIGLGHRRLAIIDLSPAGHQPMVSGSGRFTIAYNGEIYNFRDIRAELDASGARVAWRGESDTEVLLAAIDHWGVAATLTRLNGMFAFAVWDRETRTLTLARDRMGEKPLYYGSTGGAFLFGSELKALHAHPDFNGRLDRDALVAMLRYDYVPAPHSIWLGIAKLEAGHFVEIHDFGRSIGTPTAYWSLRDCVTQGTSSPLPDSPELLDDFERLLSDSVGRRMMSDVPLGAFLSGGIDSSLIVALMQAQSPRPVQTFTIGFDIGKFDEAPMARTIAKHLGTDHTELYVSAREAFEVIPQLPRMWDEPFGDSSQIPTFLVSEMSRRSVTVALSGDGGDELFGGYSRYHKIERAWAGIHLVPGPVRAALSRLVGLGAGRDLVRGPLGRAATFLQLQSLEELYRWRVSRLDHPAALVPGASEALSAAAFGPVPSLTDPGDKMMYADTRSYLPENILTKVDRASMAVSLEVRAPFLDHRVVEHAWRLPRSQRMGAYQGKAILRTLGQRHLPPEVMRRKKQGFCLPVEDWVRGPLRSWGEDLLSEQRLAGQGLLDVTAVRSLWRGFLDGKARHDSIVWNILMFQAWLSENGGTGGSAAI